MYSKTLQKGPSDSNPLALLRLKISSEQKTLMPRLMLKNLLNQSCTGPSVHSIRLPHLQSQFGCWPEGAPLSAGVLEFPSLC